MISAKAKIKSKTTHYMVLGMPPSSTFDELHQRYLELSRQHHPDTGGDSNKMAEINLAWGVLKNKIFRQQYDHKLELEGNRCTECKGAGTFQRSLSFTRHEQRLCKSCLGTGQKPA